MSLLVVGGVAAGVGVAAAAGVTATAGLIGAGVAGGALGMMSGGGGGGAPQSASGDVTYNSESLYEALLAQSDPKLASQLYAREANQDYGRPAYARLEQRMMEEAITGESFTVDGNGMITRTNYGSVPEGGKQINSETEQYEHYVDSHRDLIQAFNSGREGKSKAEFGYRHYREHGQRENRLPLPDVGSILDRSGNVVEGETVQEYIGEEFAGQKINSGGVASTVSGNQMRDFYDQDGNKIEKRAGFDSEGNFEGTAQLATDIAFDTQQQNVQQELGLVEEYGTRATETYRDQGDIRGSLNTVKALSEVSALDGVSRSAMSVNDTNAVTGSPTTSDLRSSMLNEAIMGMNAGGSLTAREQRAAQQAARSAMQSRGRVNDFGGIMAEMEMNERYRASRRQERQSFAGSVMNSEMGLMDRQTARDQLFQGGLAQDRQNAAQRVGIEQSTSADPFKAILDRDSGAGVAAGTNLYGSAESAKSASPNLYNPQVGLEFNQNAAANRDTYNATIYGADQERKAGMISGLTNAVATAYAGR